MLPAIVFLQILAGPAPSRFWTDADALCADPAALSGLETDKLGDAADARDELFAYCKFATAPRFAARGEAFRDDKLTKIYQALGKPRGTGAIPQEPERAALAWLDQAGPATEDDELGYAGQRMLSAVVGEVCALPDGPSALPATCAAAKGALSIRQLRNAVVLDIARAVMRAGSKAAKGSALQVAALFAWVLEHEDLAVAIDGLPALAPDPASCATSTKREECEYAATAVHLLVAMTSRILRDGPKLDRHYDHYENVVEEILREEAKKPDLALTAEMKAALKQLVDALKDAAITRLAKDRASAVEVQKKNLEALKKAAVLATLGTALVKGTEEPQAATFVSGIAKASTDATAWLALLAETNPRGFFDATKPVLEAAQDKGGPSAAEVRLLGVAAGLAASHDSDDIRKAARDALVPIPAWVDRFVLDLNFAPPEAQSAHGESNFSLNGDVTVGYNGDHFGFVAHADSAYYDLAAANNSALTERYAGELDVWGLIELSKTVSLEPRLSAGFAYYGTLADDATTGIDRQTNQDSIMGRGSGLLGVRIRPAARVALGLWGGAGGQYEDYYRVIQTSLGDQGTTFNANISLKYEARLRFQWNVLPSIASLRARADFNHFAMRRDDQAVTVSLGQVTSASQGLVELEQTEIFGRAFIDADIARFFGFVPAIHGGFNTFILASSGSTTSTTVPVFGVGIRREAF